MKRLAVLEKITDDQWCIVFLCFSLGGGGVLLASVNPITTLSSEGYESDLNHFSRGDWRFSK